ncbi:ATP-binding protein [Escherichia coli]|nr:ATP-binding protein [Escherichia coli]WKB06165.1 ATP-binding protein [Escherichia coli]
MNHLYEQLTALKLTGFRDALKKQLAQPGTYQELGFEERLSLLTAEELTCRENRKAERLIKHARFRPGHIPGAGLRRTPVITDSRRTNLP